MKFFKKHYLIITIVILGLILRIWGINFGLPYQFHQDEPIVVNHALAYGTGDFNPHFFIIPPLTSYILFFIYAGYFLIGSLIGIFKGVESFAISFFKDPTYFYLIGRVMVGFVPSLFSIYLTYRLALKFFSRKTALYCCFVMSVCFLNVINAHYIYADNLMVLFILLAYMYIAVLIESSTLIRYILSGVFIGIATATKYNAALLVMPFFLVHLIAAKRSVKDMLPGYKLLIFMGVAILLFVICNPYSVLDWRFFLLSVTTRIRHGYTGWSHHIAYSISEGLGVIPTMLGIVGLGAIFRIGLKKAIFIVSFPVLFYIHLVFISQPFSRYALVLMPFFSIGLGFLLFDCIYPRFKSRMIQFTIVAASLVIIIPTAIKSIKADILFASEDTRTEATEWIEENIPPFTKFALDHTFFRPQIRQTAEQLENKHKITSKQPELQHLKSEKLNYQIKALQSEKTYEIYYTIQEGEKAGQFLSFWPVIGNNLDELKKYGIEYIVFNNMGMSESMRHLYKQVAKRYNPVAIFSPYKDKNFRDPYDEIAKTCIPVKSKELFSRQKLGPYLIIYRLR